MTHEALVATLVALCLGSGMMAGLFCSFSSFLMRALSRIPLASGIQAMQSINLVIVRPSFLIIFMGTGAVGLAAVVFGGNAWRPESKPWALAATLTYVVGCVGVTIVFNVPWNNRLAAVNGETEEGHAIWKRYLSTWVRWNHVRSVATLFSTVLFLIALIRLVEGGES